VRGLPFLYGTTDITRRLRGLNCSLAQYLARSQQRLVVLCGALSQTPDVIAQRPRLFGQLSGVAHQRLHNLLHTPGMPRLIYQQHVYKSAIGSWAPPVSTEFSLTTCQ
jgi:hypothetical protein